MKIPRIWGGLHALAINVVTIYGVFGADWPVGTAIAVYWTENVLMAVAVLLRLAVWQRYAPPSAGLDVEGISPRTKLGDFVKLSLLFNGAHVVFLLVIVGLVFPRMAPDERFALPSFQQGLLAVAILIFIDMLVWIGNARRTPVEEMQRAMSSYVRRVVVVHLTIVCGMFGIVLVENATAFFAAFAILKTIVETGGPFRNPATSTANA